MWLPHKIPAVRGWANRFIHFTCEPFYSVISAHGKLQIMMSGKKGSLLSVCIMKCCCSKCCRLLLSFSFSYCLGGRSCFTIWLLHSLAYCFLKLLIISSIMG